MTYPSRSWWMRVGLGLANLMLWATRRQFHIFLHRPDLIIGTPVHHGLQTVLNERGWIWTVTALRRTA